MKKKMIALAVAGAFAVPATSAFAVDVSGFADVQLTVTSDPADNTAKLLTPPGENAAENQFSANAELDFTHTVGDVTVRADVDLTLASPAGAGSDSGELEQAYAAWKITPMLTAIGGVFNNPIGQDEEDIVDQRFISHSATFAVLDHQTYQFHGNNVAGVALTGMVGPATVTGAVLNDIGNGHGSTTTVSGVDVPDSKAVGKNSLALNVNVSPSQVPGLDVEFGLVTQESYNASTNPSSAGNVYDLNASYDWMGMVDVGFDYLVASDIVDAAYDVWVKGTPGMGIDLGLRYSAVSWDSAVMGNNADDHTATSVYAAYSPASNLELAFEWKDGDQGNKTVSSSDISGIEDGTQTWINITAKF